MTHHAHARPHSTGQLHGDEAVAQESDAHEGGWSRAQRLRMDLKFRSAMSAAPEAPTGIGPDRVAESLLPPRRP